MDPTPANKTERAAWGEGRIAYAAHAQRIAQYIAQGWPLKKIYRELESQLNGLSYQQFTYHVRRQGQKEKPAADKAGMTPPSAVTAASGGQDEQIQAVNRAGKPARYQPGPRIPDPSQLY